MVCDDERFLLCLSVQEVEQELREAKRTHRKAETDEVTASNKVRAQNEPPHTLALVGGDKGRGVLNLESPKQSRAMCW